MKKFIKPVKAMNLHLFDGAASAGDGGASSASSASAGTASENNSNADNTQSATGRVTDSNDSIKQVANASRQNIAVTSSDDERRAHFEDYIRGEGKSYFDERVQKIINGRFKETKTLEKNAKTLEPMLKTLASIYGVDADNLQELSDAVLNDNKMYEEKAKKNGVSVEVQKKFDKIQLENEQLRATQQEQEQNERTQRILDDWHSQAKELKQEFPDFDFDSEINSNKDFYDLIAHGQSVRIAYIASNIDKYTDSVRARTEKNITDNIKARGMRPNENGVSSTATASSNFNVKNLTPAQRRDLANRAEKGEIITFK